MPELKGSQTHANLKDAFAGESQANRRYLYFAKVADVEGQPDIAGLFRDTAEGETPSLSAARAKLPVSTTRTKACRAWKRSMASIIAIYATELQCKPYLSRLRAH